MWRTNLKVKIHKRKKTQRKIRKNPSDIYPRICFRNFQYDSSTNSSRTSFRNPNEISPGWRNFKSNCRINFQEKLTRSSLQKKATCNIFKFSIAGATSQPITKQEFLKKLKSISKGIGQFNTPKKCRRSFQKSFWNNFKGTTEIISKTKNIAVEVTEWIFKKFRRKLLNQFPKKMSKKIPQELLK